MGGTLILVRHGESQANAVGLFTGLLDVPLTATGNAEAREAAALITAAQLRPSVWFCSPLRRATQTSEIMRTLLQPGPSYVEVDWRLAERNYGALTGKRKADVLAEYGEEKFLAWRRSVHMAPPPMTKAQFAELGDAPEWLGLTESLAAVITRVGILWRERIEPAVQHGGDVLVVAHGNSLRALCTVLDRLDEEEIQELNIPTGHPLVYRIGDDGRPLERGGVYLDPEAATLAAATIAHQGGT
ncbi:MULTISPECIES: 2,3-bisphosphoglycerate-dependent phosphoglycerate mutase [unclassified Microbacterium]|uniref:2,3-bisphosphoglycerate-dependent phosphoglycerate mutase n=1 Tax=unclassified Microbacterium TaxID=2609290 RepID=UPI00301B4680